MPATAESSTTRRRVGRILMVGGGVVLTLVVASVGVMAYLYRQATALPDWYDPDAQAMVPDEGAALDTDGELSWSYEAPAEPVPAEPRAAPGPSAAERGDATRTPKKQKTRRRRAVMRDFHLRAVAKDPVLKRATRTSRAEFKDGKLEAGAVLDMRRIERDDLSAKNRKFYDRATRAFPPLREEQVYLALEDEPVTRDGYLQLGEAPRVKIGNLSYSLDGAARRVGMSPRALRNEIDRELRRLKVRDPSAPLPPLD